MSYVAVPPSYYYAQQPGTPFRSGAPGWWSGPVPGWGENPNSSWPGMQAANGLGEASCTPAPCPPPPDPYKFTYRGKEPQWMYTRLGIAPWGAFPHGPAYQSPRESNCPECDGWPVSTSIGDLAQAARAMQQGNYAAAARKAVQGLGCGPCQVGPACATCPNDSDLPECSGCIDGQLPPEKKSIFEHPLAGPVIIGLVSTLVTGAVIYAAKKHHVPVTA